METTQEKAGALDPVAEAIRALQGSITEPMLAMEQRLSVRINALSENIDEMRNRLEAATTDIGKMGERVNTVASDMDRAHYSMIHSMRAASGSRLPQYQPNLVTSGARFKTTMRDYRPASIYN